MIPASLRMVLVDGATLGISPPYIITLGKAGEFKVPSFTDRNLLQTDF
jgi:hypothetical protein